MWTDFFNTLGSIVIGFGRAALPGFLIGVIIINISHYSKWKLCKEAYRNLNSDEYECKVERVNDSDLFFVIEMTTNIPSIDLPIFRLRKYKNGMVAYKYDILINSGKIKYVFPYQIYYSYKFNKIFKQIIQNYPSESLNSLKRQYGENVAIRFKVRLGEVKFYFINKSPFKFLR